MELFSKLEKSTVNIELLPEQHSAIADLKQADTDIYRSRVCQE
jgi:hypothetical protein